MPILILDVKLFIELKTFFNILKFHEFCLTLIHVFFHNLLSIFDFKYFLLILTHVNFKRLPYTNLGSIINREGVASDESFIHTNDTYESSTRRCRKTILIRTVLFNVSTFIFCKKLRKILKIMIMRIIITLTSEECTGVGSLYDH